mmetsp:Transcript_22110/g.28606  ORF Transcript_22110/g.28606 Transcript_22110/m.28606 type:complete len:313 (+) Transcript_22110:72-1010(+)|eukprot:CAMPEP_0198152740 /NCGR_PEP_ID=MMETSP1443-20131203/61135_1 /TAXON_ID=186043 /ORGANISM="Entomoneis sp., Strain CCMP2396" /LENGTH=312 /DNA_ID=CAMNT_0043818855 /DNA_START=68 /DNA_END=1006 /DNA_ORIENTATION=+
MSPFSSRVVAALLLSYGTGTSNAFIPSTSCSRLLAEKGVGTVPTATTSTKLPMVFSNAYWCDENYSETTEKKRNFASQAAPSSDPDFYEILGLDDWTNDLNILKSAYRHLAKQYHPDAVGDDDDMDTAVAMFQEITEAYKVLSNPDTKQKYDLFGQHGPAQGAGFITFGGGMVVMDDDNHRQQEHYSQQQHQIELLQQGLPINGRDLRIDLEIDIRTGTYGGEERIQISHLDRCGGCYGTGRYRVDNSCCGGCGGKGRLAKTKELIVKIPPGANRGHKIHRPGLGDVGLNGGRSGDLVIILKSKGYNPSLTF